MLHVNENTLTRIVNYEKTIFNRDMTSEKLLNISRSKKAYGMKTSQNIIYVNEYFYWFFSTLKDIMQTKRKTNHWISSNLMIVV